MGIGDVAIDHKLGIKVLRAKDFSGLIGTAGPDTTLGVGTTARFLDEELTGTGNYVNNKMNANDTIFHLWDIDEFMDADLLKDFQCQIIYQTNNTGLATFTVALKGLAVKELPSDASSSPDCSASIASNSADAPTVANQMTRSRWVSLGSGGLFVNDIGIQMRVIASTLSAPTTQVGLQALKIRYTRQICTTTGRKSET